jgi:hypothetical protein
MVPGAANLVKKLDKQIMDHLPIKNAICFVKE